MTYKSVTMVDVQSTFCIISWIISHKAQRFFTCFEATTQRLDKPFKSEGKGLRGFATQEIL